MANNLQKTRDWSIYSFSLIELTETHVLVTLFLGFLLQIINNEHGNKNSKARGSWFDCVHREEQSSHLFVLSCRSGGGRSTTSRGWGRRDCNRCSTSAWNRIQKLGEKRASETRTFFFFKKMAYLTKMVRKRVPDQKLKMRSSTFLFSRSLAKRVAQKESMVKLAAFPKVEIFSEWS